QSGRTRHVAVRADAQDLDMLAEHGRREAIVALGRAQADADDAFHCDHLVREAAEAAEAAEGSADSIPQGAVWFGSSHHSANANEERRRVRKTRKRPARAGDDVAMRTPMWRDDANDAVNDTGNDVGAERCI